ncbi:MAG: periplasmic binding protein/LacI transcriptional regulator [Herbinix sp.]|jgi:ribose transport system substrate-binding protein|nr:periplasmic binding protein/LacI transcriptional regulator [Herbinix sp.]
MKARKIIIDIAVIIIALLIFIIWHQRYIDDDAQMTISRVKFYEVYLITTDKEYQYWDYINQGAADMAAAVGINYTWDAPEERNVNKQIDIINRAVEIGVDALLIAADDPKRISGVVEDAKAKGVKVIYVDSPAFEEAITTLATDNYEAGVRAGETMISILDNMGISKGSIGIIGYEGKANTALRERGFRDTLAKDVRFNVLETINTARGDATQAQEAAEQLIKDNEDLVALFGINEGTSVGVGNAIRDNGNRFVGVGFDQTDVMMELLREGSLKAIIAQNPYTMGYLGMAEAVAAILGKDTGPEYIDTGVSVIRNN